MIAGSKAAVDKACEVLKAKGAKRALPLPVSAPFHSSLMKPAAETLRERLAAIAFAAPQIPVVNNIEVAGRDRSGPHPRRARTSRRSARCAGSRCVQAHQGARRRRTIIECGPGKVLAGLAKRIDADLAGAASTTRPSLAEANGSCWHEQRPHSKARSRWSPAPRAASAPPSRWNWPQRGMKVIGTATTDEGAAKITAALCRRTPAAGARRSTSTTRRRPRRWSTPSSRSTAACTCWSTTPASRATCWPCA